MCGITFVSGKKANQEQFNTIFKTLRSRGESSEIYSAKTFFAGTRRLKIVDPQGGKQPFFSEDKKQFIIFNGEIFNYQALKNELSREFHFRSSSDTEVLLYAHQKWGMGCLQRIKGQFAFIIVNTKTGEFTAARDHFGIVPLYYTYKEETTYFSSTISSLTVLNEKIHTVSPGTYRDWQGHWHTYYHPGSSKRVPQDYIAELRSRLKKAISIRIPSPDTPVGVIYSGGLDSTIVLHEISKVRPDVKAFTVGRKGCEDFEIAKRFCRDRNIEQVLIDLDKRDITPNIIEETIQKTELSEYLDIINGVISLFLFKEIHNHGIKVVLGGDGSDELFGGYNMYNKIERDQSDRLFKYKLNNLHRTELQRVDRCGMAYKVETRVPFLDPSVAELAFTMPNDYKYKEGWEKWCVRQAFKDELPEYIIKRHKNPLSHSSGIHEIVRIYKPSFRKYYKKGRFHLCEPIKKDFAVQLIDSNWDIEKAIREHLAGKDFSLMDLFTDSLKARVRVHVLN